MSEASSLAREEHVYGASTMKKYFPFSIYHFPSNFIFSKWKIFIFKNKYQGDNRGTTLIELLIYIGLLAIFISVLTGLFGTSMDIFLSSQSNTGMAVDSTYILSRLTYDIQRAETISTPSDHGDSSSSLTLVIDGVSHSYSINGSGDLVYTNNLGSFNLNSHTARVSSMVFSKIGNAGGVESTIKVDMLLTSRVVRPKGEESVQISTTIASHRN